MCTFLIKLLQKLLVMPMAALAIAAASVGALCTALVAEHFFGVDPCILCIYQRVPYVVAAALASIALLIRKNDKAARAFLAVCALAFFIDTGIAFFHSGVEQHWWAGTKDCVVSGDIIKDPAELRRQLLVTAITECDKINFSFLGLSMANWNILATFGLGVFALLASFGSCVINWGKKSGCCCSCGCKDEKKD